MSGCYELRLPASAWIDVEAAVDAIYDAEAALRAVLIRALECRARVYLWNHEYALAVEAARESIEIEPFRETSHQLLMRAHGASGNTAEALHAYERCRRLIAEELGADPSPETKALHLALLRGASS